MIFWIASYPKSGNTWLRSLLSSYYYSENGNFQQRLLEKIGQFPEKKYFTGFDYNPAIITDTSRFWIKAQEKINADKKIKFFKTHNILGAINDNKFTNIKNTIGCIYIVRDPRNVVTSLKNHYEMSTEDAVNFMVNEKKYIYDYHKKNDYSDFQFISSWEKNYKSWINNSDFPIKLIKYEDLLNKTFYVVKDLINFIDETCKTNVYFDKHKAQNAIATTSFEKLKKIEKNYGFSESIKSKNQDSNKIPFFHLGPSNDWKFFFETSFGDKINKIFKESLQELHYH